MAEGVTRFAEFRWQRGTAARWLDFDGILKAGEPGLETDTGNFKVGDGFTPWVDLPYFMNEDGVRTLVTELLADVGAGDFDPRVGDLDALGTDVKTTIVDAINEVNADGMSYVLFYENQKAG